MPMLNPAVDVLGDPNLLDTFSVIRRQETVNTSGESVQTPQTFTGVYGVVKVKGDNDLERTTDGEREKKGIYVVTMFALRGAALDGAQQSWQPDLIVWHGNQYTVRTVRDWGGYGIGYTAAECDQVEVQSMPPQVNSGLGN